MHIVYDIVIEAFEHRMGIPVEVTILPRTRCQRLVERGVYDMLVTIPTPGRLEYSVPTASPIWVKRADLIIEDEAIDAESIRDLRLAAGVVATDAVASESGFHILIGRHPALPSQIDRLNRVVDEMRSDGTVDAIPADYGLSPID